jgi:hypothetical protein
MNKNNLQKVKIVWQDATSYKIGDKIPHSISIFETTGLLAKENDNYVIIEKPITINALTGKNYPEEKYPTFCFIPRGMIEKIEQI